MTKPPAAILFDADGVLQHPTIDWREALASYAGLDGSAEEFALDIFAAEGPALIGAGDFRDALTEVLTRWNSRGTANDVLQLWSHFKAEPEVIEIIQNLRAAGFPCHLATNQHAYRKRIMNDERHYGDWFDHSFYSCDLGVAKPDPAYFHAILDTLGLSAEDVVFIDDNRDNIAGAASVGLRAEHYELETGVDRLRTILRSHGLPA